MSDKQNQRPSKNANAKYKKKIKYANGIIIFTSPARCIVMD
ncbi:hypothetical protein M096_4962 [Parabacteroides distasonis str. 3999B T(B) 6]|nr:hypothetical protein M095_3951 [Parabacteroides distasonis str. 3999B T(B) 4]KDS65083.1 hypothetical protein M096_4962 [Parabacteroides distasonis str. 3999B T(B) 6]